MNLNPNAIPTFLLSFVLFWLCASLTRHARSISSRVSLLFIALVLAIPGTLYVLYYAHLLDNAVWFYRFRALPYSEVAAAGLGVIAGFLHSIFQPKSLGERLVLPIALGVALFIPFMKSVLDPVDYSQLRRECAGEVCLQSTQSTCGPSSAATLLKPFGQNVSEQELAQESFTYRGGTEIWYLARALRKRGFRVDFVIQPRDRISTPIPAIAGVILPGGAGPFIAIVSQTGNEITIGDPLKGKLVVPEKELPHTYHFTGFFMQVRPDAHH